jgi:DNA mismatch endonuclease, patch repair protein
MDTLTRTQRSKLMSSIRSKHTRPELTIRRLLHRMGYRFRLHATGLPGQPDIVLPKWKTVVFVNGCFWHAHSCQRGRRPATNTRFWRQKLLGNVQRDNRNKRALCRLGWLVVVIWECDLQRPATVLKKLRRIGSHVDQAKAAPRKSG